MKKSYIGVATNRALSMAHCAQKKKKKVTARHLVQILLLFLYNYDSGILKC